MRHHLLLLLTMIPLVLSSQVPFHPFAPQGAQWTVQKHTNGPHHLAGYPSFTVKVVKDTVIDGKTCQKMVKFDADTAVDQTAIYWHSDSGKVYFYEKGAFRLFMDFTLQTGDTLTHYIPMQQPAYSPDCCSEASPVPARQYVSEAGFDTIAGTLLRAMQLDPIYTDQDSTFQEWNMGKVRERIGGFPNILGNGLVCCLGGFPGHVRCYQDSEITFESDSIGCSPVGVRKVNQQGNFHISPNPASHSISVTAPFQTKAAIYSLAGRQVKTILLEKGSNRIRVNDLSNGVYLFSAIHQNEVYSRKLVINR